MSIQEYFNADGELVCGGDYLLVNEVKYCGQVGNKEWPETEITNSDNFFPNPETDPYSAIEITEETRVIWRTRGRRRSGGRGGLWRFILSFCRRIIRDFEEIIP